MILVDQVDAVAAADQRIQRQRGEGQDDEQRRGKTVIGIIRP